MKKVIFLLMIIFSLEAFADDPGAPARNTPLVYKVYFKKLGFSTTSNKNDCVYIFNSAEGTGLDLASVNIGAAVGTLAANAGTLPAGTYTHICGLVKNGFDIVGRTSIGCTDPAYVNPPVTIAFGGHTYVSGATGGKASTTCTVSSSDTPVSVKAPTSGEDIHVPEGVVMTADQVEFIKQLPNSFTITSGGAAPTFSLSFDVTNTLEMVSVPPPTGSNLSQVAVFIQPPMPSVTAGS